MTKRIPLSLLLLASLVACSRSEPEPSPEANDSAELAVPPATASPEPAVRRAPEPSADVNGAGDEPLPPEVVEPNEQMLDDASATGMTARANRDEEDRTETLPANSDER